MDSSTFSDDAQTSLRLLPNCNNNDFQLQPRRKANCIFVQIVIANCDKIEAAPLLGPQPAHRFRQSGRSTFGRPSLLEGPLVCCGQGATSSLALMGMEGNRGGGSSEPKTTCRREIGTLRVDGAARAERRIGIRRRQQPIREGRAALVNDNIPSQCRSICRFYGRINKKKSGRKLLATDNICLKGKHVEAKERIDETAPSPIKGSAKAQVDDAVGEAPARATSPAPPT
uniref:Uncharacterized protein n=1 Tax=Trichuris muris TaxID=70415 RepID=A0A5S6QE82_TRIMR